MRNMAENMPGSGERFNPAQTGPIEERSDPAWYVVNTQPRNETRATCRLEAQGYRVFCPRYYRTVRHARQTTRVLAPVFSNYLFVHLDVSRDQWHRINGTRGVVRLLTWDGSPQRMPGKIIDDLLARTRSDGTFDWTSRFEIGGPVRIADGPFAEFVGTLESLDAAGRVRILLDVLGRSVSVALRGESLLPTV
jgi:transcription elongation factor/antiterminator RfaH